MKGERSPFFAPAFLFPSLLQISKIRFLRKTSPASNLQ